MVLEDKPEKRSAYRERTGKATYSLEVYTGDKERMKRWLKQNGHTQAEGLKLLLDFEKIVDEWLSTLDTEANYWDGVCLSDRQMAERFVKGKNMLFKSLIDHVKSKSPHNI